MSVFFRRVSYNQSRPVHAALHRIPPKRRGSAKDFADVVGSESASNWLDGHYTLLMARSLFPTLHRDVLEVRNNAIVAEGGSKEVAPGIFCFVDFPRGNRTFKTQCAINRSRGRPDPIRHGPPELLAFLDAGAQPTSTREVDPEVDPEVARYFASQTPFQSTLSDNRNLPSPIVPKDLNPRDFLVAARRPPSAAERSEPVDRGKQDAAAKSPAPPPLPQSVFEMAHSLATDSLLLSRELPIGQASGGDEVAAEAEQPADSVQASERPPETLEDLWHPKGDLLHEAHVVDLLQKTSESASTSRCHEVWRELRRAKVTAQEMWGVLEALAQMPSPEMRRPLRVAFSFLRLRRDKAAAKRGRTPLLPDIRNCGPRPSGLRPLVRDILPQWPRPKK